MWFYLTIAGLTVLCFCPFADGPRSLEGTGYFQLICVQWCKYDLCLLHMTLQKLHFLQDVFDNLILGLYIINTFIIYSLSTTNVFDIDIPCIKTHFFKV